MKNVPNADTFLLKKDRILALDTTKHDVSLHVVRLLFGACTVLSELQEL